MRNVLVLLFWSICTLALAGGDPKYPVSAIPAELKTNVDGVIREDILIFKILSRSKASEYVHEVVTVLNERGKQFAREYVFYDKHPDSNR